MERKKKKNILLIGNKPSLNKIDYSHYDTIVQVNRMQNLHNVPKVDIWYCDCHHDFFKLPSSIKNCDCNFSYTKILIPREHMNNSNKVLKLNNTLKEHNVYTFPLNNKMSSECIGGEIRIKNILTSDVIVLLYLLKYFPNDNISIAYFDVDNRGEILSNQETHKRTWHENAVYDEEIFLKDLINEGKINFISDNSSN